MGYSSLPGIEGSVMKSYCGVQNNTNTFFVVLLLNNLGLDVCLQVHIPHGCALSSGRGLHDQVRTLLRFRTQFPAKQQQNTSVLLFFRFSLLFWVPSPLTHSQFVRKCYLKRFTAIRPQNLFFRSKKIKRAYPNCQILFTSLCLHRKPRERNE